ncbi:MAG: 1,4-alpha-glucan branching protein GlgB [Desulfitobacterium hafniense]|nr:1,4-alpha-glucan branching protein GlgB [Desulfitobacterium hafniense]
MNVIPYLSAEEIYLFNQGEYYQSYVKFGGHLIEYNGIKGTHFAVWAPNSLEVCVVGDFNGWCGAQHRMSKISQGGVWALFIPGLLEGELYKYQIYAQDGREFLKSDPYAFCSEKRPATASIIYTLGDYNWQDEEWLKQRFETDSKSIPLSIYEVHLGSWKRKNDGGFYNYRELAVELIDYVVEMGYTHIELVPVMEHPFDGSWGYQVTGYYSCTSRYGEPNDLMYLIDQCHQAGIGVIFDWVPGHFCKDAHGLGYFDGTPLYENEEHEHWGTYKFNFAKTEVWSFLISNAVFWFDKYHIDGLRVDGVSSMLYLDYGKGERPWQPNIHGGRENLQAVAFMQKLNEVVFKYFPGVLMIAEEATDWPLVSWPPYLSGLGYSFKWNMGWMNDTLRYMQLDFDQRKYHHKLLTFSLMYAFSENFILPLSHDEVVHGKKSLLEKMPGDYWQQFAGLRSLYSYFMCHPGKKLFFMGGELAQFIEWRYQAGLDWHLLDFEMHRKYQAFTKSINQLYLEEKSLWENDHEWSGFEWIDVDNNQQSIIIFCRRAKKKGLLLILINFTPSAYDNFRIGVPVEGTYREIFNSDRESFGGSNLLNINMLVAEQVPWHQQDFSLEITVPPLACVILKPHLNTNDNTRLFKMNNDVTKAEGA